MSYGTLDGGRWFAGAGSTVDFYNASAGGLILAFNQLNAAYLERFGFPFVICARLNDRRAILEAFRRRLENSREQEIATALKEIDQIAALRLAQIVHD